MASGVFGLRKVYKKQVENVTNNNFASWPESASRGYYAGGYRVFPTYYSLIFRLDYSNESVSNPGNVLPAAIGDQSGIYNSTYGYFGGGYNSPPGTYYSQISRLDYLNETVSLPGNNLPSNRSSAAIVQNNIYGYFCGGYVPGSICTISRFDFSNETASDLGNNLNAARHDSGNSSSSSYGYILGGGLPNLSSIDRLDFSSEVVSNPGYTVPFSKNNMGSVWNSGFGYIAGGYSPIICTVSRLDFSNDTVSDPGINLPASRRNHTGTQSTVYGYFGGGYIDPGPASSCTILRLDFSSEVITTPGNNLTTAIRDHASISGGASVARGKGYKTYGYYGGGYRGGPSIYESRIERIEFSTETDSIMPSQLIYQHSSCNTVSSNNHGYFVGGFVPNPTSPNQSSKVQRFDFISEVVTELPSQASYEISGSGTLSNAQYGFVAGGLRGPGGLWTCNVVRLDFSSDSMSQPSSNLTESRAVLNGVSDIRNNLGYLGGGYSSCRVCRIDLSSETITQHSDTLNRDTNGARSCQSSDYGYWAGGAYTPNQPQPSSQVWGSSQKIAFSTGTIQNGNTLYAAKYDQGVSQDNYYAWYTAGMAPPYTYTSDVQRLDFNTETFSNPANPLGISRASNPGGLSN